jgi:hypothetical protein
VRNTRRPLRDPTGDVKESMSERLRFPAVHRPQVLDVVELDVASHGKSPAEARAWVFRSDERDAEVVVRTRGRADAVVPGVTIRPRESG